MKSSRSRPCSVTHRCDRRLILLQVCELVSQIIQRNLESVPGLGKDAFSWPFLPVINIDVLIPHLGKKLLTRNLFDLADWDISLKKVLWGVYQDPEMSWLAHLAVYGILAQDSSAHGAGEGVRFEFSCKGWKWLRGSVLVKSEFTGSLSCGRPF